MPFVKVDINEPKRGQSAFATSDRERAIFFAVLFLMCGIFVRLAPGQDRGPAATTPSMAGPASMPSGQGVDVLDALSRSIRDVSFKETKLADVFMTLQGKMGVPIVVDWAQLKTVNIDQATPITQTIDDLPAGVVLTIILQYAAPSKLSFFPGNNVITISTSAEVAKARAAAAASRPASRPAGRGVGRAPGRR